MEQTSYTPPVPDPQASRAQESQDTSGHVYATSDSAKGRPKEGWRSALSTIIILILAPVVAVLLTTYVFQSYEVDGPSMEDTLQNRDRLIVWKVPRTISRVTGNDYIPGRGEVIIFNRAEDAQFGGGTTERQLIKRVVGLPGERVVVRDGRITIYNKEHPNGFNPDAEENHGAFANDTQGNIDLTVPDGEIFVAGDNRANSLDSRVFGTVPAEDVVGNLAIRIFPFNKIKAY